MIVAFPDDAVVNLVSFYKEICKLNIEEARKEMEGHELAEYTNTVCRDILPRHLIVDTLAYGKK